MKLTYILMVSSGLLVSAKAQETATPLTLEKTIPLEKVEGRIDHLAADVAGQRLFVAALGNNTVEVVDLKAGKEIQSLPGFAEPQGIVYVPEFDRIFVAKKGNRIFANTPGLKQIAVLDRKKQTLLAVWQLADVQGNYPMATLQAVCLRQTGSQPLTQSPRLSNDQIPRGQSC